jgi:hypothetical protein
VNSLVVFTFAGIHNDSFSVSIGAGNEYFISDDDFIVHHQMKRLAWGFQIFGDVILSGEVEIQCESSFASCTFLSTIAFESHSSVIQS